jgi:hypothetical protein
MKGISGVTDSMIRVGFIGLMIYAFIGGSAIVLTSLRGGK